MAEARKYERQPQPRVAYLVGRFPVLSQTFVAEEIADHLRAGLDVQILAMHGGDAPPASPALDPIFRGRVTFLDLPRSGRGRVVMLVRALALSPMLVWRAARAAASESRAERHLRLDAVALAVKLAPFVRERDILHCHFGDVARVAAAALSGLQARTRLVATFHGYDVTLVRFQPLNRAYRRLLKTADLLLPVSRLWAERLIQGGADERRTFVHHMGVDVEVLRYTRLAPGATAGRLRLAMVGRMVEKKGHRHALSALTLLRRRRPDLKISLVLAGDGPLREEIERSIVHLDLSDIVVSQGARTHQQCLDLIQEADAILLPSVTSASGDMEGIPVVLMEAMALGRPIVSSRHSGIPELVEDGVSGFLAEEGDVEGLAAALERLADDPDLRVTLAENGREKVVREFDAKALGEKLRGHYDSLCRGKGQ